MLRQWWLHKILDIQAEINTLLSSNLTYLHDLSDNLLPTNKHNPINKKQITGNTLYVSTYNEIFLNSKNNVFDRNRLYGGLGYRLNDTLRFEIGYMNQFLNEGSRDQINIMTFINF